MEPFQREDSSRNGLSTTQGSLVDLQFYRSQIGETESREMRRQKSAANTRQCFLRFAFAQTNTSRSQRSTIEFGGHARRVPNYLGADSAAPSTSRIQIFVVIFSLRGELDGLIAAGFGIFEDFSFVITDDDFFVVVIENVAGIDRHFAAATGRVDDVLRDGVTGGMAAQSFDDLDPFRDRRAQMR